MLVLVAIGVLVLGLCDQPKLEATATSSALSARARAAMQVPQGIEAAADRESAAAPRPAKPSLRDAAIAAMTRGQPADGDNVFALAERVHNVIRDQTVSEVELLYPGEPWPSGEAANLVSVPATPREREVSRAVVLAILKGEVPRLLAEVASADRAVVQLHPDVLTLTSYKEVSFANSLARFQSARRELAAERGDWAEVTLALNQTAGLVSALRSTRLALPTLFASGIEMTVQTQVLQWAAAGTLDEAGAARIADALARPVADDPTAWIETERLFALDTLDFMTRQGPGSDEALRRIVQGQDPWPDHDRRSTRALSSAEQAEQTRVEGLVNAYFADAQRYAAALQAGTASEDALTNLIKAEQAVPAARPGQVTRLLRWWLVRQCDRAGARTIIALERYRLAYGEYPSDLLLLVPQFLESVPLDPCTGEPLVYRPPADEPYEGARPYLLYSVGPDGRDDGGRADPCWPSSCFDRDRASGRPLDTGDYLLNRETAEAARAFLAGRVVPCAEQSPSR